MKNFTINPQMKKIVLGVLATLMLFFFYSCAKKTAAAKTETTTATEASASNNVSEAKGQVQIKRDVNSNYVVQINLKELEEVNKLDPATTKAYIVWIDADQQKPQNLGQINSNTGWLSDKSKANFEGVSQYKPTKVYITEEINATVKVPGKQIIWSTNRF